MTRSPVFKTAIIGLVLSAGLVSSLSELPAVEPARAFLQALRDRKMGDMALEYLDRMENSPLAPVELKQMIQYERGITLIEASRLQRDMGIREKQLDEAQVNLEQFVKTRATHPKKSAAESQLGNLLVERGRMKLEKAEKGNSAQLRKEARELYDKAYQVFLNSQEEIKTKLERFPKVMDPRRDKERIAMRDQLRADYLQVQLLAAAIKEESVDTVAEGSKEYKELLTEASKLYETIYEKYRTRLAGLYARMYQGRCLQKVENYQDALSFYGELLEQPDNPDAFRTLKTKTMKLAMESWTADSQKKFAEAITQCSEWIGKARPNESRASEYMELRLMLARANMDYAKDLKVKAPKDPQIGRSNKEAKTLATFVARYPGEFQKAGRSLLAEIGGGPDPTEERPDPKNFEEAKTAGKEALESMQTAQMVLKLVPPRLAKESDATVKAELQTQIDEANKTIATAQQDAMHFFRMALQLTDQDTSIDDVNIVRYFLCYLHYVSGNYFDSSVLGKFIAQRYPGSSGARQCAKIAMASNLKIFSANSDEDKSFETQQVIDICEYITKQWSDHPEAIEALNTLIPFMIQAGELEKAQDYLKGIPESSDKRGMAELKTGQALWSNYLMGMQEVRKWEEEGVPDGKDLDARKQELVTLKESAQTTLANGIARMKAKGLIDETIAVAVLSLSQIYVDTEQAAEAIGLLENDSIGILKLVNEGHPATKKPGFAAETYKTALRAYIASLASGGGEANIEKASGVMDSLKTSVGSTAGGQKRLIAIYISLAKDLQTQMELIQSPKAKQAMSKGFETFLKRVGQQSDEFNVVNWVADTFFGMAQAFDTGQGALSPDAKKYYDEAIKSYETILDKGKSKAGWIQPPQMETQVRMRMISTYSKVGKFEDAKNKLVRILSDNNMMLSVQIQGAKMAQEKADGKNANPLFYLAAMQGYEKDQRKDIDGKPNKNFGKNIIWGWGKLSLLTAGQEKFQDTFYMARYNLAECRFKYAMKKAGDEQKTLLAKAKNDITQTVIRYKALVEDPERKADRDRFDKLLQQIQEKLGEKKVGLAAVIKKEPATSGSGE